MIYELSIPVSEKRTDTPTVRRLRPEGRGYGDRGEGSGSP